MAEAEFTPLDPCGSWRATKFIEGNAAEEIWCDRKLGPCPYLGTVQSRPGRTCAAGMWIVDGEVRREA